MKLSFIIHRPTPTAPMSWMNDDWLAEAPALRVIRLE